MKNKLFIAVFFALVWQISFVYAQSEKPKKIDAKKVAKTLAVGMKGYEHFIKGVQTGEWQPFFEMLTDDFTIYFPQGKFQGEQKGKEKAMEFFRYVSDTFKGGFKVTEVLHVTASETTIIFELRDEAILRGNPYKNRVALSWDVRGEKLAAYREYFGSDGKSN
jgi:ketosteroid isomerase-like protein